MNIAKGTFAGLAQGEIELIRKAIGGQTGIAVEIGCCDGFSTAHILECCQMQVTTIDPFIPDSMAPTLIGSEERFWTNVRPWMDRIRLIHDYSYNVVGSWTDPIDFLFIDGDHNYNIVLQDYEQWTPFLKVGGVLGMHDSRMSRTYDQNRGMFHPGPSQVAADEVYGRPDKWQIFGENWALTLVRKLK